MQRNLRLLVTYGKDGNDYENKVRVKVNQWDAWSHWVFWCYPLTLTEKCNPSAFKQSIFGKYILEEHFYQQVQMLQESSMVNLSYWFSIKHIIALGYHVTSSTYLVKKSRFCKKQSCYDKIGTI